MIDTQTKNTSFIKMYKILKDLGINNNKFFLQLNDPKLQNVDPYDKNLTNEQKQRIIIECKINFWYFLREVIRINVPGGKKRYELHRGNLALSWCMYNCYNIIEMLPRQHGKTIGCACFYTWLYNFGTSNSNMIFSNKELPDAKRNLKHIKDLFDNLPIYLKNIVKNKNNKDNIEYIENAVTGNTIKVLGSSITEAEADKKGRGMTTPIQWMDEFAFLKYNDIMYLAAAPAATAAKLEAKKNNKFYGTTIITTPNSLELKESQTCKSMIDEAVRFDEHMYDWTKNEMEDCISTHSNNNFIYIEFSYKELGKDEKWFNQQCRDLLNDLLKIRREILLEWTRASDISVFTEEQLANIEKYIKEPSYKLQIKKYWFINMYEDINFDKSYIVACDCATGLSQDSSAMSIIDPITRRVIGEFKENKIDTRDYQEFLIELITKYFPNSVLVIENNSIGKAILDNLMRSVISQNLYFEYQDRIASKIEYDKRDVTYSKKKQKMQIFGITTNKSSRDQMMEILGTLVDEEPEILATKFIYSDIKTLERDKKGKVQHCAGGHDDSLFSFLIGMYALIYGQNLNKFHISKDGRTYEEFGKNIKKVAFNISNAIKQQAAINDSRYKFTGIGQDVLDDYEEENKRNGKNDLLKRYNKFNELFNN